MKQKIQNLHKRVFRAFLLVATLSAFIAVSAGTSIAEPSNPLIINTPKTNNYYIIVSKKYLASIGFPGISAYEGYILDEHGYDSLVINSVTFSDNIDNAKYGSGYECSGIVLNTVVLDDTAKPVSYPTTINGTTQFLRNTSLGGKGGAIYNVQQLTTSAGSDVKFCNNTVKVTTANSFAQGGAIYNAAGAITFDGATTFGTNSATAAEEFDCVEGGAIYNCGGGTITFDGTSTFENNSAKGEDGSAQANAGAIHNAAGDITFNSTTTFRNNSVEELTEDCGASGGAINNCGEITFSSSSNVLFEQNKAIGSSTRGGAIANMFGTITFDGAATFISNSATATGEGGKACGGAINNEEGTITFKGKTSFRGNKVGTTLNDICNYSCYNSYTGETDYGVLNFESGSITTLDGGINGRTDDPDYRPGVINFNEGAIITMNDLAATANSQRDFKTLTISDQNFNANGGTFVINTDLSNGTGDVITLNNCTIGGGKQVKIQVAYDPSFATSATITGEHKFLVLPSGSTEDTLKVTGIVTDYNGVLYLPILAYDDATSNANGWKITALKTQVDETSKAVSDGANVMNFVWLETVNNLQKRLGDLRGGEASDKAWARFQRSNDDYKGSRQFNVSGNMYQVGYDFALKNQVASRGYFGVSLEAFDGTQSYKIGGGDVKSMSLGAYYTKIYDTGHYFDFILRYGRLESDTQSYDSDFGIVTDLDYAQNSFTLSGEYGYRANLGKSGLYLEPQAEFIYGYLAGAKATSSTNILADIDSTNHFVTRLGLAFGQRVKNFNYYLRGSYYHDFAGTTNVKYGDASYKQDSAQNWWEVSLGGGWNISKLSYFYAELTKHFKDVSNSLNFNVGFRFTL